MELLLTILIHLTNNQKLKLDLVLKVWILYAIVKMMHVRKVGQMKKAKIPVIRIIIL